VDSKPQLVVFNLSPTSIKPWRRKWGHDQLEPFFRLIAIGCERECEPASETGYGIPIRQGDPFRIGKRGKSNRKIREKGNIVDNRSTVRKEYSLNRIQGELKWFGSQCNRPYICN